MLHKSPLVLWAIKAVLGSLVRASRCKGTCERPIGCASLAGSTSGLESAHSLARCLPQVVGISPLPVLEKFLLAFRAHKNHLFASRNKSFAFILQSNERGKQSGRWLGIPLIVAHSRWSSGCSWKQCSRQPASERAMSPCRERASNRGLGGCEFSSKPKQ